jgi:hypothetical protein
LHEYLIYKQINKIMEIERKYINCKHILLTDLKNKKIEKGNFRIYG